MKKLFLFLMSAVSLFAVFGYAAAQSGNTWLVMFYNNTALQGNPVYSVSTNTINYYWGTSAPGPNVLADNFSARMTTSAYLAGGEYRFYVAADGGFVLSIDGVDYIDTWSTPQAGKSLVVAVPLQQGNHSIEIDYRHISGPAFITVIWSMTGQPDPVVTVTPYPQPTSVNRISTNYGNYTSCIQQNLHQARCFQSDGSWDSPDLGSIQLEPQIVVWGQCQADRVTTRVIYAGQNAQRAKCSKTQAGWYPAPA